VLPNGGISYYAQASRLHFDAFLTGPLSFQRDHVEPKTAIHYQGMHVEYGRTSTRRLMWADGPAGFQEIQQLPRP